MSFKRFDSEVSEFLMNLSPYFQYFKFDIYIRNSKELDKFCEIFETCTNMDELKIQNLKLFCDSRGNRLNQDSYINLQLVLAKYHLKIEDYSLNDERIFRD